MKENKQKKLNKIKSILDKQQIEDIKNKGNPNGRSLSLWLSIINNQLPDNARLCNNREIAFNKSGIKDKTKYLK